MSGSNSTVTRRYLNLWMPFLSADRWRRQTAAPQTAPSMAKPAAAHDHAKHDSDLLAFVAQDHGAVRLAAVNAAAWANGLRPGLSLADARARCPNLHTAAINSDADDAFLKRLANIAMSFTPSVALDHPNGLVLDITGCAHLFAGEAGLAQRFVTALRSESISACRHAIAPTPDMARALARFAPESACIVNDAARVRALAVAALECAHEDAVALKRAGLKTIGDIADRPSVLFTARFSQAFTIKLGRILGEDDRRITPLRTAPPCRAEHRCAEPVISLDVIERLLESLASAVSEQLSARGEGGRVFENTFLRTDGVLRQIRVETSQPTRDAAVLMRLYRDRLDAIADPLDPGSGFDVIRLDVLRSEPYDERQITLDARDENRDQVAQLVDRLSAMFGRERVTRLKACDTHLPERAQNVVPASEASAHAAPLRSHTKAPRPLFLYTHPHPIEASVDDDGQPSSFRWRRSEHRIVQTDGPERISDEWWRPPSGYGTRDYYRVENVAGRQFWIFRANVTASAVPPKWFLHGLFSP